MRHAPSPTSSRGAKSIGDWASRPQLAVESFAVTATPADSEAPWDSAEASLDRFALDDATDDHPTGPFETSAPEGVNVVGLLGACRGRLANRGGLREGGRRAASRSPGVLGSPGPRPSSSRPRWR